MEKTEALLASRRVIVDIINYYTTHDEAYLEQARQNAIKVQGFIYNL